MECSGGALHESLPLLYLRLIQVDEPFSYAIFLLTASGNTPDIAGKGCQCQTEEEQNQSDQYCTDNAGRSDSCQKKHSRKKNRTETSDQERIQNGTAFLTASSALERWAQNEERQKRDRNSEQYPKDNGCNGNDSCDLKERPDDSDDQTGDQRQNGTIAFVTATACGHIFHLPRQYMTQ